MEVVDYYIIVVVLLLFLLQGKSVLLHKNITWDAHET